MKTRTVVDQVSFKRLISLPLLLLLAFPFQTAYPFVLVPVVLSFFVNLHHILATYPPRKKAGVKRPRQYANWDEAEKNPEGDLMKFNIAQRIHANFLESVSAMLQIDDYGDLISFPPTLFFQYPSYLASIIISGLGYPRTSTVLGLIWVSARMAYHYGYSSGNADLRGIGGVPGTFALMGLWVLSSFSVFGLLGEAEWKW